MPQKSDVHAVSFADVLREEHDALRPKDPAGNRDTNPLAALCISGGGIRSATFALGALQGLAEQGILGRFDYLSTVSGGGYIGSWLTSWKHRWGGLDKVMPYLQPCAPPLPDGAPDPIQHLREYNSYLAPRAGFFSADTWTLAATVGRNMFLNWMVLLPLLMAALLVPRLILSAARLGDTFDKFYGQSHVVAWESLEYILPALSGILLAIAVFNFMCDLPGMGGRDHSQRDFLNWVLLPFGAATLAYMTYDSWFADGYGETMYLEITGLATASFLAGWLAYLLIYGKRHKHQLLLLFTVTCAVLITGVVAGSLAWGLANYVYAPASWAVYTTIGPPTIILAAVLSGSLFVGFTSRILSDEDREWLSRAGAWVLTLAVVWLGACAVSLLVPMWLEKLPGLLKPIFAAAGAAAGWISALGGHSSKTAAVKSGADPEAKSLAPHLASLLAVPVFLFVCLNGLSLATDWLLMVFRLGGSSDLNEDPTKEIIVRCPNCDWWNHQAMLDGTRWESIAILLAVFLFIAWLMARYININKFSLHAMYRDRLIRAYPGASNQRADARKFTGFAETDNLLMKDLEPEMRPFHVVNVTLNLVSGERLAWQERKAESFTISPLHCGSANLGYLSVADYGGDEGMSLGTAMAISGAAASPNMGYNSSPAIAFVMTLFNARLGAWLANPGKNGAKAWREPGPRSALKSLVRETFGLTNETSEYVYLSDGGHFENLGLYEMVRRRCRYIVALDGGCDADFTFDDLGNALRKIRIDMKISIDFEERFFGPLGKGKGKRCALARIKYSAVDKDLEDGWLIYIKPVVCGNEPPDVMSYHSKNLAFPHQSTGDQFFNESQTESYRMLGLHSVREVFGGWNKTSELGDAAAAETGDEREGKCGFPKLVSYITSVYFGEGKAVAAGQG